MYLANLLEIHNEPHTLIIRTLSRVGHGDPVDGVLDVKCHVVQIWRHTDRYVLLILVEDLVQMSGQNWTTHLRWNDEHLTLHYFEWRSLKQCIVEPGTDVLGRKNQTKESAVRIISMPETIKR